MNIWYKLNPDKTTELLPEGEIPTQWNSPERTVGKDTVGEIFVSTVFLALDHSFNFKGESNPRPILFETMLFGGAYSDNEFQLRYCTWQEAKNSHDNIVKALREGLDPETYLNKNNE